MQKGKSTELDDSGYVQCDQQLWGSERFLKVYLEESCKFLAHPMEPRNMYGRVLNEKDKSKYLDMTIMYNV